ncbi:uncharacterized protein LOC121733030 isoform X2 [Aricia agestis]|uniref:uncharacterized protein LOC121731462 isoform X2 n=1 Tax=Aricia agestis TaxID=91739 RepID=UPI001C20B921|nr:uncharacterized protein LOC121731462 isoform X2 [Aricia agestis]XP_041979047.1 uncharacterized protein LOC121733030 isoform X2 [Aricia agestis]
MERVRTSHPSPAQLEALVQFLERKPSLAKGFSKSLGAKQLAHKEWSRLATTLNSMGGCIKNDKKWIKQSENQESESPSILARGLYEEPIPGTSGVLLEQPMDYTPNEIVIDNAERNNLNAIMDHELENENITLQNQEMSPETVPVAYNTENADSVQVNVSERIPLRRSRQPPSVTSTPRRPRCRRRLVQNRVLPSSPPAQRRTQLVGVTHKFLELETRRVNLEEKLVSVMEHFMEYQRDIIDAVGKLGAGMSSLADAINRTNT